MVNTHSCPLLADDTTRPAVLSRGGSLCCQPPALEAGTGDTEHSRAVPPAGARGSADLCAGPEGDASRAGLSQEGRGGAAPGDPPSGERAALGVGGAPLHDVVGGPPPGPLAPHCCCCSRDFLPDLPPPALSGFPRLEAFLPEARGHGTPGDWHGTVPCESGRASWAQPVQPPASEQVRVNLTRAKGPRGILASVTTDRWSPSEDPQRPPGTHSCALDRGGTGGACGRV